MYISLNFTLICYNPFFVIVHLIFSIYPFLAQLLRSTFEECDVSRAPTNVNDLRNFSNLCPPTAWTANGRTDRTAFDVIQWDRNVISPDCPSHGCSDYWCRSRRLHAGTRLRSLYSGLCVISKKVYYIYLLWIMELYSSYSILFHVVAFHRFSYLRHITVHFTLCLLFFFLCLYDCLLPRLLRADTIGL